MCAYPGRGLFSFFVLFVDSIRVGAKANEICKCTTPPDNALDELVRDFYLFCFFFLRVSCLVLFCYIVCCVIHTYIHTFCFFSLILEILLGTYLCCERNMAYICSCRFDSLARLYLHGTAGRPKNCFCQRGTPPLSFDILAWKKRLFAKTLKLQKPQDVR